MPVDAKVRWRNRVLILSIFGIAALTLFPFEFSLVLRHQTQPSFLLLRLAPKGVSPIDFVLNVLLFVPFGFGVALRVRSQPIGLGRTLLVALAAGALASYAVEFLQLFIPTRDSSWDDVFSNTTGAVAGAFLFAACGNSLLELASKGEDAIAAWVSPSRAAAMLALYFAFWLGLSVVLQKQTGLSNWDARCSLNVGNDATGTSPWKGRVYRLQIWDRALPVDQVVRGLEPEEPGPGDASLLVSYDLAGSPPFADKRHFLPPLVWIVKSPSVQGDPQPELDAGGRLGTAVPAGDVTAAIEKTNQFTVRVICAPVEVRGTGGRILSLSQSFGDVDFDLRQEGSNLAFWFRNPLSARRASLVWRLDDVFEAGKTRDIVASYDGSNAFLYVDGRVAAPAYRLGPGATVVHKFSSIRFEDLKGYVILYEELVFLPAGVLLGIVARRWPGMKSYERWIWSAFLLLPPILLEFLLVRVSGRRMWPENVVLSALLGVAAMLWINSDLRATKVTSDS